MPTRLPPTIRIHGHMNALAHYLLTARFSKKKKKARKIKERQGGQEAAALAARAAEQGEKVRAIKGVHGKTSPEFEAALSVLKTIKADYKILTGVSLQPAPRPPTELAGETAGIGAAAVAHAMAQVVELPKGAPHCFAGLRFFINGNLPTMTKSKYKPVVMSHWNVARQHKRQMELATDSRGHCGGGAPSPVMEATAFFLA